MKRTRVLIADDHTLFRQGMRTLLASEPDIEIVGEARSGNEALLMVDQSRPDLVLMDVSMPGLSSFEATRQLKRIRPDLKVLFLTMYDDEDYLLESMQAGASGYILKDSPTEQLLAGIRDVQNGGSYLSPKMLAQLVDDFRTRIKSSVPQPRLASLTPREKEVLKLLAEGNSVKEIASSLNLSVKTIEAHKFNLMRKLDIHNKAQLVQYAIQKKIIQLPVLA
ncbi:MAG: response regulator transcription factor [Bryobacterales bacterium]|nr:response regulator transcription factor [Bryobacterales bacterium]